MEPDKNPGWLVSNLDLVIPFRLDHFDVVVLNVLDAQELAFNSDFVPILNPADV